MSINDPFCGTPNHIATRELSTAVNAATQLQKPLLIKGEPGTDPKHHPAA